MDPINYTIDVQSPFASALQGYQAGVAIREDRLKAQQQQAALQQQMQMRQDLASLAANPTPQAIVRASLLYPQLSEQFKRTSDMLSAEQQKNQVNAAIPAYAAVLNGKSDVAASTLRETATALQNSGQQQEAAQTRAVADLIEQHPEFAKMTMGLRLSSLMGPDKFAETFGKLGAEARSAEKAPAELAKAKADAANAEATVGKTQAEADKTRAEATISAEEAKVAPQTVALKLKQATANLGLTNAQTTQALASARKLNTESQQALANAAQGGTPEQRFEAEQKLRKEYETQTQGYTGVMESYRRMKSAGDDGAGDMTLTFTLMKMLDPTSVVREGEYATAQNSAGVPASIQNLWNRLLNGQRLTDGQRKMFRAQGNRLAEAAAKREKEVRSGLSTVVKSYKLNGENVFGVAAQRDPADSWAAGADAIPGQASGVKAPAAKTVGGVTVSNWNTP